MVMLLDYRKHKSKQKLETLSHQVLKIKSTKPHEKTVIPFNNLGSLALSQDLQSIVNKEIKSSELESAETLLKNVLNIDSSFAMKKEIYPTNEYANLARIDEDQKA